MAPGGARVPTPLHEGKTITLGLNASDSRRRARWRSVINNRAGGGTATALDGRTVRVKARWTRARVNFIAELEELPLPIPPRRQGGQPAHRLHRAQPGGDAGALRHRARQPVHHHQQHAGHQPAGNPLSQGPDRGRTKERHPDQSRTAAMHAWCRPRRNWPTWCALNTLGATPQDLLAIPAGHQGGRRAERRAEVI